MGDMRSKAGLGDDGVARDVRSGKGRGERIYGERMIEYAAEEEHAVCGKRGACRHGTLAHRTVLGVVPNQSSQDSHCLAAAGIVPNVQDCRLENCKPIAEQHQWMWSFKEDRTCSAT